MIWNFIMIIVKFQILIIKAKDIYCTLASLGLK